MKTEMTISGENAEKVTKKGKFPWVVSSKGVASNSIFCQFRRIGRISDVAVL